MRAVVATTDGPLIAAVSGGGDSLALLLLMRRVAPERSITALVVDHGLRPGSAEIAAEAAARARSLGAAAVVLAASLYGRSQAAARLARYIALCTAAEAAGASRIFLGHTADDQVETILLRAAAGSSDYGLAGMATFAPAPVWPIGRRLTLARPLLGVRRATLRTLLREAGIVWRDDPANDDPVYARTAVRAAVQDMDEKAIAAALAEAADKAAQAAAIDRAARTALDGLRIDAEGRLFLPAPALAEVPHAVGWRGVAALIAAAGGEPRPLPSENVRSIVGALRGGRGSGDTTLAGAKISWTREVLTLSRDPGALLGRAKRSGPVAEPLRLADDWRTFDRRILVKAETPDLVGATLSAVRGGRYGARLIVTQGDASMTLVQAIGRRAVSVTPLAFEIIDRALWRGAPGSTAPLTRA